MPQLPFDFAFLDGIFSPFETRRGRKIGQLQPASNKCDFTDYKAGQLVYFLRNWCTFWATGVLHVGQVATHGWVVQSCPVARSSFERRKYFA